MNQTENIPVCLITGGTSGIGRASVELFCEHGYLIATCGRDPGRLKQLRESLAGDGGGHYVAQTDLTNAAETRKFAAEVIARFGRVDVLVNNAAAAPLAPFDEIDEQTFEKTLNVNIRSTFYLTQQIWRQMKGQGSGVIVNISSLAAVDPFPGFSIYGASKAWIDLMTKALSSEGRDHGIRVYSIRAGAVETPMLRGLFPDFPAEQCVSPVDVARQIWECVKASDNHESGQLFVVANQP